MTIGISDATRHGRLDAFTRSIRRTSRAYSQSQTTTCWSCNVVTIPKGISLNSLNAAACAFNRPATISSPEPSPVDVAASQVAFRRTTSLAAPHSSTFAQKQGQRQRNAIVGYPTSGRHDFACHRRCVAVSHLRRSSPTTSLADDASRSFNEF